MRCRTSCRGCSMGNGDGKGSKTIVPSELWCIHKHTSLCTAGSGVLLLYVKCRPDHSYNIAPRQRAAVIHRDHDSRRPVLETMYVNRVERGGRTLKPGNGASSHIGRSIRRRER